MTLEAEPALSLGIVVSLVLLDGELKEKCFWKDLRSGLLLGTFTEGGGADIVVAV